MATQPTLRPGPRPKHRFDIDTLEALAEDLVKGRVKLDRLTVTDTNQPGLRAILRDTGLISFHVQYTVGSDRKYLKIGDHPGTSINQARQLAKTVQALAAKGIDPEAGLHDRLIRELKEKGDKWRP